jgi:hypothetical protein
MLKGDILGGIGGPIGSSAVGRLTKVAGGWLGKKLGSRVSQEMLQLGKAVGGQVVGVAETAGGMVGGQVATGNEIDISLEEILKAHGMGLVSSRATEKLAGATGLAEKGPPPELDGLSNLAPPGETAGPKTQAGAGTPSDGVPVRSPTGHSDTVPVGGGGGGGGGGGTGGGGSGGGKRPLAGEGPVSPGVPEHIGPAGDAPLSPDVSTGVPHPIHGESGSIGHAPTQPVGVPEPSIGHAPTQPVTVPPGPAPAKPGGGIGHAKT